MRMLSETKPVAKVLHIGFFIGTDELDYPSQGMAIVALFFYLLYLFVPSSESVFAMKATNTYGAHSYVWNLFTAGFYNTNIFMVWISILGCFLIAHYK